MDVGARRVDRKGEPADIADLSQILDIDAVIGQFGADRVEILALQPERFLDARPGCRLQLLQFTLARRALLGVERPV